ncbi:MAG: ribonuclease H-like domain-containing protein [Firmicutes bacterium]|nr:ribonuclease H-like domain-containing protein [Bacillota bacterium]
MKDMEIITKSFKIPYFEYSLIDEYFGDLKVCTFDIETLGLDPRRAPMILAGFMSVAPGGEAEIRQYFLDEPEQEHVLLDEVVSELNRYDIIVTYNGKRFDLPYILKRYNMIYHEEPYIRPFDLDLYQVIKKHSSLRDFLPSLSQKTIEEYMGLASTRTDDISGAESVQLYYRYITEADVKLRSDLKELILLHNSDDVAQLYRLLPVLRQCDIHQSMTKLGFPVITDSGRLMNICSIRIVRNDLVITGEYSGEPEVYMGFSNMERPYEVEMSRDRSFKITLPLLKKSGAYYVNLTDLFDATDDLSDCAGYVNDFLILKEGKELNCREINLLCKKLVKKI